MLKFKNFVLFAIICLFSLNVSADKVYSSGGTTSSNTYNSQGFVTKIQNPTFGDILQMGLVGGAIGVNVYGEDSDVDITADIWSGGGAFTYSADGTADAVSISSDTTGDVVNIVIYGLDLSGDEATQTIALSNQATVPLTTALWRVLTMTNDGTADLVGDVFVFSGMGATPSLLDTTIRGVIIAADNKSSTTFYTIPNDKVGFLVRIETGLSKLTQGGIIGDMKVGLYSRKFGKVFLLEKRISIQEEGFIYQDLKKIAVAYPGKTDLKFLAAGDASTDSMGVFGAMELMIFDEQRFTDDYLSSIDQPGF